MSDASELWVGREVKRGQTTPVPSTIVSAKATDTLGSDTPGKDLSAVKLEKVTISSLIIMRFIFTFINTIQPTYPLFL